MVHSRRGDCIPCVHALEWRYLESAETGSAPEKASPGGWFVKDTLKVGASTEIEIATTPEMGITHLGPDAPRMYSTPSMISLMEQTAIQGTDAASRRWGTVGGDQGQRQPLQGHPHRAEGAGQSDAHRNRRRWTTDQAVSVQRRGLQ